MSPNSLRLAARILAVAALAAPLAPVAAQCPDGSAPPCTIAAAKPVVIDANRIAVLPFRVTTTDSLLGEGFAELLAPEFTGEGGPRSIDMSTTLAAWRRSGGGLRSPLAQDAAMRLARELGAGVLVQGSIVGFGGRLTVNASLVDATSGKAIGTAARAAGTADSIEALLGQVATTLLGAGARVRAAESGRLTNSPAALRAYFEGLALWRRGRWNAASSAFEASIAADSVFPAPVYQRWLLAYTTTGSAAWTARVFAVKQRLAPRERTVVEGNLGTDRSKPRTRTQTLADRRRAAETLVDSPEAWFFYGDYIYHNGLPLVGPDSVLPMARAIFARAIALDSQPVYLFHMMEIAAHTRDSALMRRLWPAYERIDGEERWARGWVMAGALRDATLLSQLRRIGPDKNATFLTPLSLLAGLDASIQLSVIDEAYRQLDAIADPALRSMAANTQALTHLARGRPLAAERSLGRHPLTYWRIAATIPLGWASGDIDPDEAFFGAHAAVPLSDSIAEAQRLCAVTRLRLERGTLDNLDLAGLGLHNVRCRNALETWSAFASHTLTDSAVTALDTLVSISSFGTFMGFEHRLLARMYETRGDTARALRAVRLYPRDYAGVWLAPTLREEGRYYLMARDTANAIRSYNHFLELRAEAEPPYVPERDSIKALVTTLQRRRP